MIFQGLRHLLKMYNEIPPAYPKLYTFMKSFLLPYEEKRIYITTYSGPFSNIYSDLLQSSYLNYVFSSSSMFSCFKTEDVFVVFFYNEVRSKGTATKRSITQRLCHLT